MNRTYRSAALVLALAIMLPLVLAACGKAIGDTIDDATINTRVRTVLLNDPTISALRIDVSTTAGVVTLSGTVRSKAEETRAVELARQVHGVRDVKSTVRVGGV